MGHNIQLLILANYWRESLEILQYKREENAQRDTLRCQRKKGWVGESGGSARRKGCAGVDVASKK
jgi:hypothetical protein